MYVTAIESTHNPQSTTLPVSHYILHVYARQKKGCCWELATFVVSNEIVPFNIIIYEHPLKKIQIFHLLDFCVRCNPPSIFSHPPPPFFATQPLPRDLVFFTPFISTPPHPHYIIVSLTPPPPPPLDFFLVFIGG